jgi:hypothetical protein
MDYTLGRRSAVFLLPIALLATVGTARANFQELLRRAPQDANTIIMIDVERLLMSPIAMKDKWLDKLRAPGAESPHFPANSKRYMLVSKQNFVSHFEDIWDVALIEAAGPVSVPYLAKAEGGYVDSLEGFEVAYSPRNAFFVSLKPDMVGVSFPANRQDLSRWLRGVRNRNEPRVSEYLQSVVVAGHGKNQIVAGFDLADLFTSTQVRDQLRTAESLAGKEIDMDAITQALTSVRGVMFSAEATDRLAGSIRIDFAESPAALKEVAKPLIIEVLENRGLLLDPGIKDWAIRFEAKAVTLQGRMSAKGLRKLTALIPFPAESLPIDKTDSNTAALAPGAESSASRAESKAEVSRKYFQHISQLLDSLRTQVHECKTAKIARMVLDKGALEIDRLPVLNVDEDLIAYGAGVAATLRNIRNLSKNASLDATYRQASMAGNQGDGYGYGYGGGGFYGGGTNLSLGSSVLRKQEAAVLQSNVLSVFTMLQEKTAEVRKAMTLKHQVEF